MQIMCSTPSVYHMQRIVCHLVQRDSSSTEFDKVYIAFVLVISLAETIIDEGGEEARVSGENL